MAEKKRGGRKVLVGISGGVDSAVTLALLKKNGFFVEAVFLCLLQDKYKMAESLSDAKKICKKLNVNLHIFDIEKKFEDVVIKYFLTEYAKGKTPNPCIFCNEHIKFKFLLKIAKDLQIDFVATGHYARIKKVENGEKIKYKLFSGIDEKKDQSYFLYRLKQNQLAKVVFPLGDYEKETVRKLAQDFGLPVFKKEDSQDVCFIHNGGLENFLKKRINLKRGAIMDTNGKILGGHRGLALYTIGQRKGIEIGGSGPYFVVGKKMKKNLLIVANDLQNSTFFQFRVNLKQVSWVGDCPKLPLKILARIRYRNSLEYAIIKNEKNKKKYWLEFENPQKAISSGQSAVFYTKRGEVLGGGIIK
jgi:tRNA-specific 2-thiouridylase